jgi:hypothetical protein
MRHESELNGQQKLTSKQMIVENVTGNIWLNNVRALKHLKMML